MSDDAPKEPVVPARRDGTAAKAAPTKSSAKLIAVTLVSLAVGAGAGWFGHSAQARAKLSAVDKSPAAVKTGPCTALEKELCSKSGDASAICAHAKGAAALLTSGMCELALETVPAMLEKANAARAVCTSLVTRLCNDLTPTSPACAMVKERTEGFAPERCAELTKNYDAVLAEAKQIERRGMLRGTPHAQPPAVSPTGTAQGRGPGAGP